MFVCLGTSTGQLRAETIVLLRHADRDRASADQELLPAGHARAKEVGHLLRNEQIDHIFFSHGQDEPKLVWLRLAQTADDVCDGLAGGEHVMKDKPQAIPRFRGDADATKRWLMGEDGSEHSHIERCDHVDVVIMHHEEMKDVLDRFLSPEDPTKGPHIEVGPEDYDQVFVLARQKGQVNFSLVRLSVGPAPTTRPAAPKEAPLAPMESSPLPKAPADGSAGPAEEKKDAPKETK